MRYVATLILFALAAPCAAQDPYAEAHKLYVEGNERQAEVYDREAEGSEAYLRALSAWRAAGRWIDERAYADALEYPATWRKMAAEYREKSAAWQRDDRAMFNVAEYSMAGVREMVAAARESAADYRRMAYEAEGKMLEAQENAGFYRSGLWKRTAEAYERLAESYERTAEAYERLADATERWAAVLERLVE